MVLRNKEFSVIQHFLLQGTHESCNRYTQCEGIRSLFLSWHPHNSRAIAAETFTEVFRPCSHPRPLGKQSIKRHFIWQQRHRGHKWNKDTLRCHFHNQYSQMSYNLWTSAHRVPGCPTQESLETACGSFYCAWSTAGNKETKVFYSDLFQIQRRRRIRFVNWLETCTQHQYTNFWAAKLVIKLLLI